VDPLFISLKQCLERIFPSLTERGYPSGNRNAAGIVVGQVQQRINFGDRDLSWPINNLQNFVSGANLTFLDHAAIESWPSMRDEKGRHLSVVHSNPEPIAGNARLRNLKYRAADSVPVSNADLIVRKAVDGKILSELSVLEVTSAKLRLPIAIGLELVDHHGALLASVALKIRLAVAIQIQSPSNDTVGYGVLPDGGADAPAPPFNFAWKTDVDRQKCGHWILDWRLNEALEIPRL
jgi:hypothetical protein